MPALPSAPPIPNSAATHPCVRCGRPVALDVAMCDRCNPLGLSDPASSQVHGTVVLAIILGVVGLAVAGRIALSGIGPFRASVASVDAAVGGLAVTISIHNEGSKGGSVSCTLTDPARHGIGPRAIVRTPRVEPGQTRAFTATVKQFGESPRPLAIACDSP